MTVSQDLSDLTSPLWNNIFAALAMVLYYRVMVECATAGARGGGGEGGEEQERHRSTSSGPRVVLNASLSTCVIFWRFFDVTHWSWRLNVLVPAAMITRLLLKVRTALSLSPVVNLFWMLHTPSQN